MSGPTKAAPSPERSPSASTLSPARALMVQRTCTCGGRGGECEECRKKRQAMQRRSAGPPTTQSSIPPVVERVLAAPGRPLDHSVRAMMEPRFGSDFGQVRVHDDAQAAESARAVNAHAYAVGQDIAFASGRYEPSTTAGRELIAHELAHTVQQRGLQRSSASAVADQGAEYDRLEREAERAAANAMGGGPPTRAAVASVPTLSRKSTAQPTVRDPKSKKKSDIQSKLGKHVVTPTEVYENPAAAAKDASAIAEFNVDTFYMPTTKGPDALPLYEAMAKGKSLESTVAITAGRTKTALWQTREVTGDLRALWLQKLGWPSGTPGNALWEGAGGDALYPQCGGVTCQMDHIVELQIGGNNTKENVQPLNAGDNRESGGAIRDEVQAIAKAVAEDDNYEAAGKTQIKLRFLKVEAVGKTAAPAAACTPKIKGKPTCLEVEACARKPGTKKDAAGEVKDYPLSAGGRLTNARVPVTFAGKPKEEVPLWESPENSGSATLIPGLLLETLKHGTTGKAKADIVAARVDDRESTRVPISLSKSTKDLVFNVGAEGKLKFDEASKKKSLGIGFTYKYLSPGEITSLDVDESGEMSWKGYIKPIVPFLGKLDVAYAKGELVVAKGLDEEMLKKHSLLGMRVTKAQVQMLLGPEFKPSGVIEAQLGSGDKPLAKARVTLEADSVGLVARGKVNVQIPKMESAESELTYLGGPGRNEWKASLSIHSEKIKLGSATVTGGFDGKFENNMLSFDGALVATFANESTAELRMKYDRRAGWILTGRGTFNVLRPTLDPIRVAVVYNLAEDEVTATGSTGFTMKQLGLSGQLEEVTVVIKKGNPPRAHGKGSLEFNKGKARGKVVVELLRSGKFAGKGTVSYAIRPDLVVEGTVELDEKQKLRITGSLTFARLKLFEGYHPKDKNLFTLDLSIPVPGASIGGVGLQFTISGGVDVGFSFGPGVVEPLKIDAGFNPLEDDPELDLGVGGELKIPASASLTAKIEGGLKIEVFVGRVKGGLGLKGTIALEGGVFAKFQARYKKNRFTAELTPEIKAELVLMLALTAFALAEAGWGPFSVSTRKDWTLGQKRIHTGIEFRLSAPFGYDSVTGVRLPSADQVELKKPEITREKLSNIVHQLFSDTEGQERPA